jgi:2-isopropylmalate synthase
LEELGIELADDALDDAFRRMKALADKKKDIYDEDIVALVDEEVRDNDRVKVVALQVVCGTEGPQTADLTLEVDGEKISFKAEGAGPVDATFHAIRAMVPNTAVLQLYQVHAVTKGTDAQAEVTVRLVEDGKMVNGLGADTDTMVASARAYVNALNKLLAGRDRQAPEALTA